MRLRQQVEDKPHPRDRKYEVERQAELERSTKRAPYVDLILYALIFIFVYLGTLIALLLWRIGL